MEYLFWFKECNFLHTFKKYIPSVSVIRHMWYEWYCILWKIYRHIYNLICLHFLWSYIFYSLVILIAFTILYSTHNLKCYNIFHHDIHTIYSTVWFYRRATLNIPWTHLMCTFFLTPEKLKSCAHISASAWKAFVTKYEAVKCLHISQRLWL